MTNPTPSPFDSDVLMIPMSGGLPQPAVTPPSGEEIYNTIMGGIEPELTTAILPTLGVRYAQETPDQKETRHGRYEEAFKEYNKQLAVYTGALQQQAKDYQHFALSLAESMDRAGERGTMTNLTSDMALS